MITRHQVILIQQAKRHLCSSRGFSHDEGEHWYREALRHNGHVASSKDLDQAGFERVMSVFEEAGFRDDQQQAGTRSCTHWRDKADLQGRYANERVVRKIEQLVSMSKYAPGVAGLCQRFSDGRVSHPSKLRPKEAFNLIEALKDMVLKYPLPESAASSQV